MRVIPRAVWSICTANTTEAKASRLRTSRQYVPGASGSWGDRPGLFGSSQIGGRTLMEVSRKLGRHLGPAENAVGAGITEGWNLLVSARLKVMASLTDWFREFRKYHRDDKGSGKIVKRDDHLMDAAR